MNVTFAALNIVIIAILIGVFVVPRIREQQDSRVDVPNSMRPNRPGRELADVVTEWAKTTGVLNAEGAVDPNHVPAEDADVLAERT